MGREKTYGQFLIDHGDDAEKRKSWEWVTKADFKLLLKRRFLRLKSKL